MKTKGLRVLKIGAAVVVAIAILAAIGWDLSGGVRDSQIEHFEEKGLTHAEAERQVDELQRMVDLGTYMMNR